MKQQNEQFHRTRELSRLKKTSEIIKSIQGKTKPDEDREIQLHHSKKTRNYEKWKAETFSEVLKQTTSSLPIINAEELKNAGQNWERRGYLNSFPCIQIFQPDANHPGLPEFLEGSDEQLKIILKGHPE